MELRFMNWPEVEAYLRTDDRIILPLGSTEQHGPRAVIGSDHLTVEGIAREVAQRTGTITAPVIPYGMSLHHLGFPGTLALRSSTLGLVLRDLIASLEKTGFKRVLILNGHGGNRAPVESALAEIVNELPEMKVKFRSWWEAEGVSEYLQEAFGDREGHHGTPGETSLVMFLHPGVVKEKNVPFPGMRRSETYPDAKAFKELYPDGIIGADVNLASPEHGKNLFERCVAGMVKELSNRNDLGIGKNGS